MALIGAYSPEPDNERSTRGLGCSQEGVGARIRELRISQGLTQEALGLEAGLSRNMIIGIEWGRKSIAYERLFDIAHVLSVPVTDLLIAADGLPQRGVHLAEE